MKKKSTYVLTISEYFPQTHARKGQKTNFAHLITEGMKGYTDDAPFGDADKSRIKIHTIRGNYELWAKRAKKINAGEAVLSVRCWTGKPYQTKQRELFVFEKIGVEKLEDPTNFVYATVDGKEVNWGELAKNDGLSFVDFCEWFKVRSTEPMAIIHFSNFRYNHES
jgi:hypothetical protein